MHLRSKAPYFPFLYLVVCQKDLFHVFEISAGGGCPSWQVISFVKCSASLLSELCPWGSPYGVTRAQGGALTSSLCVPGTWVLLKAGVTASTTAFRVCGEGTESECVQAWLCVSGWGFSHKRQQNNNSGTVLGNNLF